MFKNPITSSQMAVIKSLLLLLLLSCTFNVVCNLKCYSCDSKELHHLSTFAALRPYRLQNHFPRGLLRIQQVPQGRWRVHVQGMRQWSEEDPANCRCHEKGFWILGMQWRFVQWSRTSFSEQFVYSFHWKCSSCTLCTFLKTEKKTFKSLDLLSRFLFVCLNMSILIYKIYKIKLIKLVKHL